MLRHGDTGIGTFDGLDGEMVVVDGIAYQVTADGVVHIPAPTMTTPFAEVTFFHDDQEKVLPPGADLEVVHQGGRRDHSDPEHFLC